MMLRVYLWLPSGGSVGNFEQATLLWRTLPLFSKVVPCGEKLVQELIVGVLDYFPEKYKLTSCNLFSYHCNFKKNH